MADDESSSDPLSDQDAAENHKVHVQQLFVKHQSRLKAFVLSLLPDFAEADDVLQEAFLTVTRKAADFSEGSNFVAWAITIARFKVLEALRRKRVADVALSHETIEVLCTVLPQEELSETRSNAVRACLDKLAPRMQELVRLRYYREHKPEEIAELLCLGRNSVNVTLSKARKLMQQCIERQLRRV